MKRKTTVFVITALSVMLACTGSGKKGAAQFTCPENQQGLNSGLLSAAQYDSAEKAAALIKCGADVNARDSYNGWTPLIHAAFKGRAGMVRLLIEKGANVNCTTTDRYRRTALQYAQVNRNYEIMQMLMQAGARR